MKVPELLAPVGDFDCLVAAVQNGADSVYFGSSFFNARASATNFSLDTIEKSIDYAKVRNVKTHLTLNTLIKEQEFEQAVEVANQVYSYGIDAIIVQDLGLARFLIEHFPHLPIHASTQMTIHNLAGALKMQELGFRRVVLAREVPLDEIKTICEKTTIEIEAFLHGALCISYSGQCLFSSMIGGRSGNRGKCAQACRLPYELLKDSKTIEKGYLLSPKDVSGLSILPDLMQAGIDCFKIEGRMKTPEYVATVTRIYRTYIDKLLDHQPYQLSSEDNTSLLQVFNRGGFSTGHLVPSSEFIFKEKSNNQGLFLGTVLAYSSAKGHIQLKLEQPLAIGDTLAIDSETGNYTVSELMLGKQNLTKASIGQTVTIGRMKGNIRVGEKLYKMSSKELNKQAQETFLSGKEGKKIPLQAKLSVKQGKPVTLEVFANIANTPYANVSVSLASTLIPEPAVSAPITKERLIEQLSKTGNTPYCFSHIEIDLEDNVYLPSIGKLNELRRTALEKVEELAKSSYKKETLALALPCYLPKTSSSKPKLTVLLNHLSETEDDSYLEQVENVYLPFAYFLSMPKTVQKLCEKYSVLVYLPTIIQTHLESAFEKSLKNIAEEFHIKGVVLSNLSQLAMVPSSCERVANFTFNIFNQATIAELKKLGFTRFTASPELSKSALMEIVSTSMLPSEVFAYGKLPLMTMQYCLLSHHTHCPSHCSAMCKQAHYELKDRLGFRFPIEPDAMQTITTLYNSKITSIPFSELPCDYVRLSFLDETEQEKRMVIQTILSGNRLEGEHYTNGNFAREV